MEPKPISIPYTNSYPIHGYGHDPRRPATRLAGVYSEILFSFFTMTIPMIFLSALLLGLIFNNRVVHQGFVSNNLQFSGQQDDPNAIFVNLSATTLTTIASWSSTLAPTLTGFAVVLMSYPVARTLLNSVMDDKPNQLLTPFQLGLVVRMITNGGPGSLYHWFQYAFGWRGRRQHQPRAVKLMTSVLFVGILMSFFVFVTDTWLHFATKTVIFTQTRANSIPSNHSYELTPLCRNLSNTFSSGCTLNIAAATTFNMNGASALRLLNNVSDTMIVNTLNVAGKELALLGNSPNPLLANVDYTATSWAVHTQCKPVTSLCMNANKFFGASTPYRCPFAFQGDLSRKSWAMAFFTDSSGADNSTELDNIGNPYYFAMAAATNEEVGHLDSRLTDDPEIEISTHGATVFALLCNTTVYDVEYSSVNNTITRFISSPSNSSITNFIQGTQQYSSVAGDNVMAQAASLAGFSNSSLELASQMAAAYSKVALSVSAAAFVPAPALESQLREELLVARVPKGPLAALVLANFLLVVLGIVLSIMALVAVRSESGEIQARLSIPGLIADRFEGGRARDGSGSIAHMFEEYRGQRGRRVGIARTTEGGYAYGTWQLPESIPLQAL